jgi:hypothetical protein
MIKISRETLAFLIALPIIFIAVCIINLYAPINFRNGDIWAYILSSLLLLMYYITSYIEYTKGNKEFTDKLNQLGNESEQLGNESE